MVKNVTVGVVLLLFVYFNLMIVLKQVPLLLITTSSCVLPFLLYLISIYLQHNFSSVLVFDLDYFLSPLSSLLKNPYICVTDLKIFVIHEQKKRVFWG